MQSRTHVIHAMGVCALTFGLALTGCSRQAAQPDPSPSPALRTAAAVQGSVTPSVTLSGIVAPLQNITISSTLQEPADTVYVREGDVVRTGQVLAQLDIADLQANYISARRNAEDAYSRIAQTRDQGTLNIEQGKSSLATAQAQLLQAQQKLSLSQVTVDRDRQLYSQGFLARQILDNDTTQYETDLQSVESAKAAVENAQATVQVNGNGSAGLQRENLASAQAAAASAAAQADQIAVQIKKATIVSPVDGIVINRNINPGQYPGSSQIFVVQEIGEVYAMLNASSDQIFLLRTGTPADVTVGALHMAHFRGVVEAVLGQAQPGGTNFVVKVRVPNPQRTLQSGMVVSATMTMPAVSGTMIPSQAFIDAAHDAVRVAQSDGTTRVVPVRDVAEDGTHSVVQGLGPRDRVVLQQ